MTPVDFENHVLTHMKAASLEVPYCALALAGEAGEVANRVKKCVRDDGSRIGAEARADILFELGDVLWYTTALTINLGSTLEEIMELNEEKLNARRAEQKVTG